MLKFSKWIQTYLLYALPFIGICVIWGSSVGGDPTLIKDTSFLTGILWEVLSYNLMLWFTALIVFVLLLTLHPQVREQTLKRISNIKDQDEREDMITGRASKKAYISTFALLLLLLFLSVFQLNIQNIPAEQQVAGKTKTLSIGMNFELFDSENVQSEDNKEVLFQTSDLPLSKSGIVLLVLVWLIVSYNLSVRKELSS